MIPRPIIPPVPVQVDVVVAAFDALGFVHSRRSGYLVPAPTFNLSMLAAVSVCLTPRGGLGFHTPIVDVLAFVFGSIVSPDAGPLSL
jgi:hypothetical protein